MRRLDKALPFLAALVVAAAPAYLIRFSIAGIPTTALEILIYLFVAAVILAQWRRFRPIPRSITWPVMLFLLAAVISTAIAPDKQVALGILKAWIVDPILFTWALWQVPDREKLTSAVLTGLVAGGLFVALVATFQRLTGQVTVDGRVIGPYAWSSVENPSPNYLALYLAPLAVLAFGLAMRNFPKGKTKDIAMDYGNFIFLAGSFVLMVLAILSSYSRGGLGAVAIGVGSILVLRFWSWIRQRTLAKLILLALIALLLIAGWSYIQPDPSFSPEEGGRITASNNVRWEIWKTTVKEVIPASPILGIGLGNFQDYITELTRGRVNYDRIAPLALTPHNFFLALWVNLGLAGLVAVLWLLVTVVRRARHSLQKVMRGSSREDTFASWVLASLLGSLVALLAHGLLDTPYFKNDLSVLFWTLVILLVSWSGEQTSRERKRKG